MSLYYAKISKHIRAKYRKLPLSITSINTVPPTQMPLLSSQWVDIAAFHNPPHQYVLIFQDAEGKSIGYCRLSPGFPGCFPFVIADPSKYLLIALKALKPYLLPEKESSKLTIDDSKVAQVCAEYQFRLNYKLHKMVRTETI